MADVTESKIKTSMAIRSASESGSDLMRKAMNTSNMPTTLRPCHIAKNTQALKPTLLHLIVGLMIAVFASYLTVIFFGVNSESTFMLVFFNLLFVSLTFSLNGRLIEKSLLLIIGNIFGFLWNYILRSITFIVADWGDSFNTVYLILKPFANLVWIVSFWSISLAALSSSSKNSKQEASSC